MSIRSLVAFAIVVAVLASLGGTAQTMGDGRYDINGDGYDDLLIGVPNEDLGNLEDGGMTHLLFGSTDGITTADDQSFSQRGPVRGAGEAGDLFGGSVEIIDVDNDGYADAFVGSPGEAIGSASSAGSVTYLPGTPNGLDINATRTFNQGPGVPGAIEFGDFFGWDMAGGDFDDDGYGDVVISAPFEDIGSIRDAGAVFVLYGSVAGIDTSRSQSFSQAGPVAGAAEEFDFFGQVVATGDFNGDGFDDLAAGVTSEDIGSIENAGSVNVLYGSATGLTTVGNVAFSQAGPIKGSSETDDLFGFAVAASDLDCDGFDELVVSAPNEDFGDPQSGGVANAGVLHVIHGSASGLTTSGNSTIAQGRNGIVGVLANNLSGLVVAAGHFNDDDCGDIVFGSPVENVGTSLAAGTITVVYGSPQWPTGPVSEQFSQATPGIPGVAETDDDFGSSFAVGDHNGDGIDDLVIGVSTEDVGSLADAGVVNTLLGSSDGLTTDGSLVFGQAGPVNGAAEENDGFGLVLQHGTS